jgi:membrane protein DedA with SNARE-associated domain
MMWREHAGKTMFLGKLAYGLSQFFLMSAGLVKMPFRKFMVYALPVTLFQFSVLMGIGYYLGGSYHAIAPRIHDAKLLIAVFAIVFFSIYVMFAKYARRTVLKMEEVLEKDEHTG